MSDDEKPNPLDDLKQGLGLLFRAAKGAAETVAEKLPSDRIEKIEEVAMDAVKEVGRAIESVGSEIERAIGSVTGSAEPQTPPADARPHAPDPAADHGAPGAPPPEAKHEPPFDDAYAPEPPKGPRVG